MPVSIKFVTGEDVTERDIQVITRYKDLWIACWNIREKLRRMEKYTDNFDDMTSREVVEHLREFVLEELKDMPEMD